MPVIRRPDADAIKEFDLDTTVEIPMPDFADGPAATRLEPTVTMQQQVPGLDLGARTDVQPAPMQLAPQMSDAATQLLRELGEAEERLARKAERVELLELELESSQAAEQQLRESMDREIAAAREAAVLEAEVAREDARRAIQQAQNEQLKATQEAAAKAGSAASQEARASQLAARNEALERELAALRATSERQLESLRSIEGWRAVSAGQVYAAEARATELEQALREMERRFAEREPEHARLAAERDATQARVGEVEAALQAAAGRHAETLADQRELLSTLQSGQAALEVQLAERGQDLHAAEDEIKRLEAEVAGHAGILAGVEQRLAETEQQRAALQAQLADREAAFRELEEQSRAHSETLTNLHQSLQRLGREEPRPAAATAQDLPLEDVLRLLVPETAGAEAHVLARRTTVGRTTDNDIVLDTGYISRHHAVLLASSKHTIVEDLNSTNGVRVNGRRVTRQVLRDGDVVMIGKSVFHYQLKPVAKAG